MSVLSQAKKFFRVLFFGAPTSGTARVDPLAKVAGHLRYVNMSVEDDRLADPSKNSAYVESLD